MNFQHCIDSLESKKGHLKVIKCKLFCGKVIIWEEKYDIDKMTVV